MRFKLLTALILMCITAQAGMAESPSAKTPPLLQADVQQLPANYMDGWSKLGGTLLSAAESLQNADGEKIFALNTNTKLGSVQVSQVLKIYDTLNAVYNNQWNKIAEQTGQDIINKMWPLFGSYMALHSAVKTSFEAVLANWSQELYASNAYRNVVNVLNDAVVNQAKNQEPYLPSFFLKPGSPAHKSMLAIEDRMFTLWMNTSPDIELGKGDYPSLIRHVFGKDPKDDRETFNGFLQRAVMDQKGMIVATYERVREDSLHEAMRRFYEQTAAELKRKQKMMFFVIGTRDDYGGRLIEEPVGSGDILAFESNPFVPFLYSGESARLVWQVYMADGTPVEGLHKVINIKDGDKIHNARMRFRIDNLPAGDYYVMLSRCVNQNCENRRDVFTVGDSLKITRAYLSLDQEGLSRINRDPLSGEAQFFQVDYKGGGSPLHVELVITDAEGKDVFSSKQEHPSSGAKGRFGFSLSGVSLREGEEYTAKVSVSVGENEPEMKTLTFTPKFYSAEITGPESTDENKRTAYKFRLPSQMIPPFKIDTVKNAGEVSQVSDNSLFFTPKAKGARTLAVVIADSKGKKAVGFKKVQVNAEVLPPPQHIEVVQPEILDVPVQSNPVPYAGVPSQPAPPAGASSNQGLAEKGREWLKDRLGIIKSDLSYPCSGYVDSLISKAYSNLSDSHARQIAEWDMSGASGLGELTELYTTLYYNALSNLLSHVSGMPYSECNLKWMRGFCGKSSRNTLEKAGMQGFYSAYMRKAPQSEIERDRQNGSPCIY
ncbi:hypothetical protein ADMFC3_29690 [Geovibrio sp. ADMFC3]